MSTESDIRTTLRQVADAAEVPPIDRVGFLRRTRRHRNRRWAGIAAATSAAVIAVALVAPVAVDSIGSDPGTEPPAAGSAAAGPPAYFTLAGRAVMLEAGRIHELGVQVEAIVGPTTDGVLIVDRDFRLVRLRTTGPDGDLERVAAPTTEPVASAAVSVDGTRVAVIENGQELVVYDLTTGDEVDRTRLGGAPYLADFSDRVLYVNNSSTRLGLGADAIEIPASDADMAWATGGDTVAVSSPSGTRLYDVSSGTAEQIDTIDGKGDLSADGRYYLAATEKGGNSTLWDRDSGESRPVTGLVGRDEQIRWLDDDTALVVTRTFWDGEQMARLNACEASTLRCHEIYDVNGSGDNLMMLS